MGKGKDYDVCNRVILNLNLDTFIFHLDYLGKFFCPTWKASLVSQHSEKHGRYRENKIKFPPKYLSPKYLALKGTLTDHRDCAVFPVIFAEVEPRLARHTECSSMDICLKSLTPNSCMLLKFSEAHVLK